MTLAGAVKTEEALDGRKPVLKGDSAKSGPNDVVSNLRRGWRMALFALIALDVIALLAAASAAYVTRQRFPFLGRADDLSATIYDSSSVMLAGWLLAIALFGGYNVRLLPTGPEIYRNVLQATLAAAGIIGTILYLTEISLSRPFFLVLFLIGPIMLLLVRVIVRRGINAARSRGHFRERVLAVGSAGHIRGIARTLHREHWLGYDIVGAALPVQDEGASTVTAEIPVLGNEANLLELVRDVRPSVVLFTAGSAASAEEFRRVAWELEDHQVRVIVVPALTEISSDRVSMRPVAGLPLVHMDLPRSREALRWTKRLFDIAASSLGLILLTPLFAVIAIGIKAQDGGPVIFKQTRVGRNGETFEFLKFRSMVPDAEERLEAFIHGEQDRGNTVMFKMADDPRITRIGKVLRRYSLDELPQLWNVLRGDMSLVGPRPALPREVSDYDHDATRRLAVRPGITGLWQVSGRSDLSWDDTVRLDLYYVDNWSFTQDIQILSRTVSAVVSSNGAY